MRKMCFLLSLATVVNLLLMPVKVFGGYLLKDVFYEEIGIRFKIPSDWDATWESLGNREYLIMCKPKSLRRGQHATAPELTFGILVKEQGTQPLGFPRGYQVEELTNKLFKSTPTAISFGASEKSEEGGRRALLRGDYFRAQIVRGQGRLRRIGYLTGLIGTHGRHVYELCFLSPAAHHDFLEEHLMNDMLESVHFSKE